MNGSGVERPRLEPSGRIWCWWRGDPLPELPPLPGLSVRRADAEHDTLAALVQVPRSEIQERVRGGHRPYVAELDGELAAYGWSATRKGSFWDGRVRFLVPSNTRYLWDFKTLPPWRSRGIYSRLLHAILLAEREEAERFWILHEWANTASQRGIARAGFQLAGTLYIVPGRRLGVAPVPPGDRGRAGAAFLHLPVLPDVPVEP